MAIVIDVNVFGKILPKTCERGESDQFIHDWLFSKKGKMAFGGKKYKEEMKRASKYLSIINEWKKQRKIISLEDNKINELSEYYQSKEGDQDFDDPHLIAIIIESKSEAICTYDTRAGKFIKKYTSAKILNKQTRLADTRKIIDKMK